MSKLKRIGLFLVSAAVSGNALANGFSTHVEGGWALAKLEGEAPFYISSSVENQYTTPNINSPFIAVGAAYQWDHLLAKAPVALNLGLTLYHFQSTLQGTNTVGINLAPPGVTFDRLAYSVDQSSTAVMLEPKLIYTAYAWQPYVTAGIGDASNQMGNYTEAASSSGVPTATPFSGNTTNNFAYSVGAGIQHKLIITDNPDQFTIGLEYRYMNWGSLQLGPISSDNSSGQGINFGKLKTSLIGVNVIWNF